MATLKELYTTLKSLRGMNLPINEKLLKAADELEEKIIKEEILPSLSENIQPLLNEIQRDLVLVVEYHPDEPISVALSRKVKISEIVDAKQLSGSGKISTPVSIPAPAAPDAPHIPTKQVLNHTKGLCVTFPDGTVICLSTAIQTLVAVLRKIGFAKIPAVGIQHGGYNLVDKTKRAEVPGRTWQHECDGWYIYSNTSNKQKREDLQKISDYYGLGLKIEELKEKYA